jgi:hypothetical protein
MKSFLLASMKLLTYSENRTETLFWIPFSVIGRCSPVSNPHWLQGKCAKFILSKVAFDMIYRITDGFPYAFSGSKSSL